MKKCLICLFILLNSCFSIFAFEFNDFNACDLSKSFSGQLELFDKQLKTEVSNHLNFNKWYQFSYDFLEEIIYLKFPEAPRVERKKGAMSAVAVDYSTPGVYSLLGFFPPLGDFDRQLWLETVLEVFSQDPFTNTKHTIYENEFGNWILDVESYTIQKGKKIDVKGRAIATPHNAYILSCFSFSTYGDWYTYFLENFSIRNQKTSN